MTLGIPTSLDQTPVRQHAENCLRWLRVCIMLLLEAVIIPRVWIGHRITNNGKYRSMKRLLLHR